MSVKLMALTWGLEIPVTEKMVLLALADAANDEGLCWPSAATLYKKCSLSERCVRKAFGELVRGRHLTIHERTGRSNYFTVHPCTTCTPAGDAPLHVVHPTPAPDAPPPLHVVHPTPARGAPIIIREPSSEPSGNRQSRSRAARSTLATRLPPDFGLTPERRAMAEAEKADPDREFAQFTDHFRAAPGAKGRKNDWDATWRNWCRRAPDFKPRGNGHPKPAWVPPKSIEQLEAEERERARR